MLRIHNIIFLKLPQRRPSLKRYTLVANCAEIQELNATNWNRNLKKLRLKNWKFFVEKFNFKKKLEKQTGKTYWNNLLEI